MPRYLYDGHCKNKRFFSMTQDCKFYKSTSKNDNGKDDCARCAQWMNIDTTVSRATKVCNQAPLSKTTCTMLPHCRYNVCKKTSNSIYPTC